MIKNFIDKLLAKATPGARRAPKSPFGKREEVPAAVHGIDPSRVDPRAVDVVRTLQQKLVGSAAHLELDGNGRISLPSSHRNAVGIEKKAVLMGMGDKFELWSEQAHRALIQQTLSDEDLGDGLLDLKL